MQCVPANARKVSKNEILSGLYSLQRGESRQKAAWKAHDIIFTVTSRNSWNTKASLKIQREA